MSTEEILLLAEITLRTLWVCGSALLLALLAGVPIGIALGSRRFVTRGLLVSSVNAGMGAPPVVVGLIGSILLARSGPFGGFDLLYTPYAMILTSTAIALPLVIGLTLASVGSLDEEWDLQVRTLGIGRGWRIWLLVREIRVGLLAAVIAAMGGILSEVGAVNMVGGNIAGETRVLTTAIMMHTSMGEYEIALGQAAILVGNMLLLAGLLTWIQQSGRTR
ncbi:MAG: tungstate transporter permease [bacterium]|nr:tungstate transporter permease [Deltaproteobacteria bacterium]MCP4904212.1 tungstate transporter permease [bacterium]